MKRISIIYPNFREVLDCASPLALLDEARQGKSGGGPPHSKTLARRRQIPGED
jgi:hypothetical protein